MKQLDINPLRKSVTVYIALTLIVFMLVAAAAAALIQHDRQKQKENEYKEQVDHVIQHTITSFLKGYSYRVRKIVEDPEMANMIKEKDREGLYSFLKPKWELLQEEEEYVDVMHLHSPDGTSLLRMHKPDQFGDELSSIRPIIKEVHTSHKPLQGYKTGKHGNVYRIIQPLFDENKTYIGAIEIGFNPNFILRAVHEINGFFGMIFIEDESLKLHSAPNKILIDGYRLQSELTPELEKISRVLKVQNHLTNNIKFTAGGKTYFTHLFVLKDFHDEVKVKILFFQDISEVDLFHGYLLLLVLFVMALVFWLLLTFIYRRIGVYQDSVDRVYKEQLKKINESESRFRLLYEKAPTAYQSLDVNGNILIVNTKWSEELGYASDEAVGKNFRDFLLPEDVNIFHEYFVKAKAPGVINHLEFKMLCKDGKIIDVVFHGKIIYDEKHNFISTQCGFENVTEQKILESKLKFNEAYLESMFDVSPNIIITTDGEAMNKINRAMLDFFGYESFEAFKSEHHCICEYFLEDSKYLQATMGDVSWLEYILNHKDMLHKVLMLKDGKKHHFILKAEFIKIDESNHTVVFFTDITEIEELSTLMSNIINSVENVIFVKDNEFRYLVCNSAFERFVNVSQDNLIGKSDYDIFDKETADFFRAKDALVLAGEKTTFNYEWVTHSDSKKAYLLTAKAPLRNSHGEILGLVGNAVDITKQKELEMQLTNAKREFDLFMHFIPANILIKDEDGKIVYANDSAYKFFNQESIIGKSASEFLPFDIAKGMEEFDKKVLRDGKFEEIDEFYNAEDALTIIRILGFKIEREESAQIGLVILDITESYLDKKELHNKEEIMIAQSRHAEMGEMISMIAHQWRQPISVIAMDANNILADIELEMIEEESLKSNSIDILAQTQELSKTIDDFRNFFKPEQSAGNILLKDVLKDALSVMGKSLENNNIFVNIDTDNETEIKTFSRELMQVLINMLKNAKEALIENEVDDKKISISVKENQDGINIKICDNGGGIKEEIIEQIFNPYFTTKGEKNGTGLGLYMSKTIIEKHLQGSIKVSNVNEGTCFEISIPHAIKYEEL